MTLADWAAYFDGPPGDRQKLLNVVSLSLAGTTLQVHRPPLPNRAPPAPFSNVRRPRHSRGAPGTFTEVRLPHLWACLRHFQQRWNHLPPASRTCCVRCLPQSLPRATALVTHSACFVFPDD